MQLADLVALTLLPQSRKRLNQAVSFADAADGTLNAALAALGDSVPVDPVRLRQQADSLLAVASDAGVGAVAATAADFPPLLVQTEDPPLVVWCRGQLPRTDVAVAVVGSRAASPGAREVARRLAAGLARAGVVVVSGLARGCDGEAHRGALEGGGTTLAVLGSGVDVIYPPEHAGLALEISRGGGAVISEFPPGTPPLPHHFPLRNRIIAGVSRAVVVVEAGERSGSLITAACALEQGRDVMVVPGPVLSGRNRGAHSLLRDGAMLVESADDVLAALASASGWQLSERALVAGSADGSGAAADPVLAALDPDDAQDLDALVDQTGLPAATILARLSELELSGAAARQPGGRFVRSIRK